jgi:hypothetical protein
MAHWKAATTEN